MNESLNDDFRDLLQALNEARADYVVVGAHAFALHATPRATGDLDVFVRPSPENAERVIRALEAFGAPVEAHQLDRLDLCIPGTVYQMGLPPRRIDILTSLSGLTFEEAWATRVAVELSGISVPFLGRDALIRNKRATGRDKDLLDLKSLLDRDV